MNPSKKSIVKAAERVCARTPGMSHEAGAAWEQIAGELSSKIIDRVDLSDAFDAARIAMLKSIIEGNDVQSAALDGRKAVDLYL
ncbi:hypothetical protein [Mesorhizobium sp. Cs1299R1N3]|uniref:hypothetical protein n=1 Tax=Mesorhizobium sp. Cs1299R1N3 TaxID=3015173 RepID=UPI00301B883B